MDLKCGYFASKQYKASIKDAYKKLDNEMESVVYGLMIKFPQWIVEREKLNIALLFEACNKLVAHPTDLIGLRRLKVLEESLMRITDTEKEGHKLELVLDAVNSRIRLILTNWLNLKPEGIQSKTLAATRTLMKIVFVILIVNVFDYVQDFKFVKTFWRVGQDGQDLEKRNTDKISSAILLKFYPPAMFLTIVMIISSILVTCQLPTLWFKYKVEMMMKDAETEAEKKSIDPKYVMNQHNLSLTEASKESIWQMMVQWGVYFSFVWFISWRLSLSSEDVEELEQANETLHISNLYMSLVSSILSLSVGQFRAHNITTAYRTSTKQKMIYFFSCVMSTISNVLIMIVTIVAQVDFSIVGQNLYEENTFSFFDYSICIIFMLLITPLFYNYLILPTSTPKLKTPSADCPSFYEAMSKQCLVISLYISVCALLNSFTFCWGTPLEPSLGDIAFNITRNPVYLGKKKIDYILYPYV